MLIARRIRERLADTSGFTLVELLVSMLIGMIVLSAILTITEVGARSASRTSDRAETTQRSRTAMTQIVQGLRTQVCVDVPSTPATTPPTTVPKPPVASATKDDATGIEQLTYYSEQDNLPLNNPSPTFAPQKRRLTFDPQNNGSIVEDIYEPSTTTPPFTWPATPTRTKTLATRIERVPDPITGVRTDFLRYYGFETTTPLPVDLSTSTTDPPGIPDNSIAKVVRIDVSFRTKPSNGNPDELRDSDMETSVSLRNSDYTSQTAAALPRVWGPQCD